MTPPWLARLHEEWVSPTEFHTLWQPRWKETSSPLYAATPKWQRLWRNGAGRPHQGFFVRDNLLFKVGFFTDRLCVPCPDARIEILRQLHDSAMAGHCGRHKTAARPQERYYWRGMWADVNKFVLSSVVCQRNRAVKRAMGSCQNNRHS